MKNTFKSLVIAALFSTVLPAQAAVQTYSFSGTFDSGFYNGQIYSGNFSFDDAGISNVGLSFTSLLSFNMNILNTNFTLANATTDFQNGVFPDVSFQDGSLLGLSLNIDSTTPGIGFTFIAGSADTSDAYVAYDTPLGFSGAGNVVYTQVPEADTYAMLLAGLGVMGTVARRRKTA